MAAQVITSKDLEALGGHGAPRIESGIPSLLAWCRTWYRRHRLYRDTVSALSELDDRVLADIGISRHQIDAVAWAMSQKAA